MTRENEPSRVGPHFFQGVLAKPSFSASVVAGRCDGLPSSCNASNRRRGHETNSRAQCGPALIVERRDGSSDVVVNDATTTGNSKFGLLTNLSDFLVAHQSASEHHCILGNNLELRVVKK